MKSNGNNADMNGLRRAGILLPVFSLPSPYGIGTIGKAAFDFVDFLADAGQSLWQILPMGPVGETGSPYQSISAFAGNPLHIDIDVLIEEGLLTKREVRTLREKTAGENRVNYAMQQEYRVPLLFKAAGRLEKDAGYRRFIKENLWWLNDLELCFPEVAETAKRIQYIFDMQWRKLKRYANARGVGIIGDLPFYIGSESADYAAHPELFATDESGKPFLIAGVPPDAFTEDGQIWNEPVYDWKENRRTGYEWWLHRFSRAASMYDLCRVDHFRAFAQYFAIPAGRPANEGKWIDGPGRHFIDAVRKAVPGFGIIAEDLGIITDDVHELREYSGYPGMRVLQFAFDPDANSTYLPHNHAEDCVVYTGTHDNPTLHEWVSKAGETESEFARAYLGTNKKNLPEHILKATLASIAGTAIIPLQDYMGKGAEARINTPGTVTKKNWTWRLAKDDLTKPLSKKIKTLATMYGRS